MSTNPQQAPPVVHVGDYTLLSRIGEGGMGVVHLARRPDGHRVALKVLRPHIVGDDEARERLAREVNSLSRIRSKWVAEIEDADPYGPIPYVATRYVPGLSLHDHVHEDGPITDLAWFAARLADGLDAVHSVGVLHRDIKPSNVLMEGRAPILIDFGLARVADDPRLTHTGWLLGTPGYLAPEILHGEDATTASDVHSWAATVAFAGTGNPPFGRGPSMAIMDRVRRGEHDLSGVPDDLRDLLHAALSPEPAQRPTLDQIRGYLGIASVEAAGPPMTVPMVAAPVSPAEARTDRFEKSTLVWPTEAAVVDPFAPWPDEESDQQPVGPVAPGLVAPASPRDVVGFVAGGRGDRDRPRAVRRNRRPGGSRLDAARWFAGRQPARGPQDPPWPEVVRRGRAAAQLPLVRRHRDPGAGDAHVLVGRTRARGGTGLLRARDSPRGHARGDGSGSERIDVVGPGRVPLPGTGAPGGGRGE